MPECQIILRIAAARDDGCDGGGANQNSYNVQSCSHWLITTTSILTLTSLQVGCHSHHPNSSVKAQKTN